MKKFLSNCKGAVTIFVTLLLIPSILVSGTAVDAARIYTTRNAVQNANQLAANASLASYNSLLKDLYVLFGFMQDDPELAVMVDEYLRATIHGVGSDRGTFRSFIGSDEIATELEFPGNLRKTEVLKQQILEYMKYRGPAILMQKVFGSLGSNVEKIEFDSNILDIKMEIDDSMEGILGMYRVLYDAIMQADSCRESRGWNAKSIGEGSFSEINGELDKIRSHFEGMEESRIDYNDAPWASDERIMYAEKYNALKTDIAQSANKIEQLLDGVRRDATDFKVFFTRVVTVADDLDRRKESVQRRVDDLRRRLENGECSDEIYNAFMSPPPDEPGGLPLIDRYDELLKTVVLPMAQRYRDEGNKYIDDVLLPALDDPLFIRYRDSKVETTDVNSLTLDQLRDIGSNPDFNISGATNRAGYFAGLTDLPPEDPDYADFLDLHHYLPVPFYKFGSSHFPEEQVDFWENLVEMVKGGGSQYVDLFSNDGVKTGSEGSEKEQRKQLGNLKNLGEGDSDGSDSQGAQGISDPGWNHTNENVNWSSLAKNVVKLFRNPKQTFLDYRDFALVLTYDMSMFSNYTTTKPNKGTQYSITGVPMGRNVNYYYQSEWEYLLVGKENARDNLNTIKNLILAIRLILNFVSVWSITEINIVVNLIRALPIPFGIPLVLGEVARLGFWAYESKTDLDRLRNGYKVALIKDNSTWLRKPSSMFRSTNFDDQGTATFSYEDYLSVFFIAKAILLSNPENATNVLVNRTADLIEWNVTNYQQGFRADETKMNAFLEENRDNHKVFRMKNAATTVTIRTTVEMRMLFLSMPFAQKGVNGIIPPKTLPITATDFRGY